MTIEEKALKLWGRARSPETAIWILKDGTMIEGCHGGFRTRSVDHAEIGQFFKTSVRDEPGSGYLYIRTFIRRGNIRMSMDGSTCFLEFYRRPGPAQQRAIGKCFAAARRLGKDVEISIMPRLLDDRSRKILSREQYLAYMARYAKAA